MCESILSKKTQNHNAFQQRFITLLGAFLGAILGTVLGAVPRRAQAPFPPTG
jgi:hypothetical protein